MKYIFLLLITLVTLGADEIKRIESIVNDIAKLRTQYTECQEKSKQKDMKIQKYKEKINNLENRIIVLNNQLKTKDKTIKNTIKNKKQIAKTKEKTLKTIVYQKCDESNPFPKLIMKDSVKSTEQKIEYFEASAFRLNKDAGIYDAIDGALIENWENETSFTSNQRTQEWIKITGYFVDKVWRKADKEMWVKASDADQR